MLYVMDMLLNNIANWLMNSGVASEGKVSLGCYCDSGDWQDNLPT